MKWFKHDSNANADAKLRRVRMKYGMEGYGLYWYCLELVAGTVEKHNITFELEHDADVISFDTGISSELVQEMMAFMVKLGLFEIDENRVFCQKMATRTDEYIAKVMRIKIGTPDKLRTNSGQTPEKVPPIRREEKRIETNTLNSDEVEPDLLFTEFWILYPRKVGKKKAETSWSRLTKTKKRAAYAHLKGKPFSDTVEKFIPYPTSYINGESWDDVIPTGSQGTNWWEGGSI